MIDFKIDENKCTTCGLCAQDCPVGIIEMTPTPCINEEKESQCLKCQHCLAICPTAALSILGKDPKNSLSAKGEFPTYESMTRLIKTRRSVRKYVPENLAPELIDELLETSACAPTGHNSNTVHFSLIDNREDLAKFRDKVYEAIKKAADAETLSPKLKFLHSFQKVWEKHQVDIIFRDAPHLLIASAPKSSSSPVADSIISLSYFELLANSHQIGTLWNGLLYWVLNDVDPSLTALLNIPENYTLGYALVFGKPTVKYSRAIQTDGLSVNRVKL